MPVSPYKMSLSLNVLNHLGLNLYSNTPAVLAEVIANAWDADATEVRVIFDVEKKEITISDNGCGMDQTDVNDKYLFVGYQKRPPGESGFRTPGGRKPMGRKGIGKLSLFSIADRITVYTRKQNAKGESFVMRATKIREAIHSDDPSLLTEYRPDPVPFNSAIVGSGTILKITDLKQLRLTQASIAGLRKRLARRFGIIDDPLTFTIFVDDEPVGIADRDYFHKARFLFQYGTHDYSVHCLNLDTDDTGSVLSFQRPCQFDQEGIAETGEYEVSGWIGIARRSNDLDEHGQDDNLNKITIVVRGKVAQEDILQEYRLGGMITKYMYGEIHAEFLDDDRREDIATSGRQSFLEDDVRYRAMKKFIERELRYIWRKTNALKDKRGLETALLRNPHVKEWYEGLRPARLQGYARKMFGVIERMGLDDAYRNDLYANAILAFEALKMNHALDGLNDIDVNNVDTFLNYVADIDAIEAGRYREIIQERLLIIQKLREAVDEDVKEKVLQRYVFERLWLLDPAWERATRYRHMEKQLKVVIEGVGRRRAVRPDIRYRRVAGAHVIIELKRASVLKSKTDIEAQIRKYIAAVEGELAKDQEREKYPIEAICIVGRLPKGWNDLTNRRRDEESLRPYGIRIITYNELINNAWSAYSKFLEAGEPVDRIRRIVDDVRAYGGEDGGIEEGEALD